MCLCLFDTEWVQISSSFPSTCTHRSGSKRESLDKLRFFFFLLLLYSKWFPTDIRSCALWQLARCYLTCFCLMHFIMKVLKQEREQCSAVYKALLYSVIKIVWALRKKLTTVDFSNSNQPHSRRHSGLSPSMDGQKLLHLSCNMYIYRLFFNGIDTVRKIIASTLHDRKSCSCQRV